MADNTKEIANVQDAATNATAAETAGKAQPERTFTQAEVNQIVAERLNRERAKAAPDGAAEPSAEDTRAKELDAREAALSCREYITEKGYPAKLLDVFPTNNKEAFTASVEKLLEAFPEINPRVPHSTITVTTGTNARPGGERTHDNMLDRAFARKGLF
jgi:hypothetical protein